MAVQRCACNLHNYCYVLLTYIFSFVCMCEHIEHIRAVQANTLVLLKKEFESAKHVKEIL